MSDVFDALRERLLTAGIAPRHTRRYVAELRDHAADLAAEEVAEGRNAVEAGARALARLGDPADLAQAMVAQGDFRSWSARAPWAVFGVGPLLALAAGPLLSVATVAAILEPRRPGPGLHPIPPSWFADFAVALNLADTVLLPLMLGLLLAATAARQRLPAFWPILGLVLVDVLGALFTVKVVLPTTPDGFIEFVLNCVLAPPFCELGTALSHVAINLALTLTPYLIWRARRKARPNADGGDVLSDARLIEI